MTDKKLSIEYDNIFNEKYILANKLNKQISTKDKVIREQEYNYIIKENSIKILKLVLFMIGLIFLVILLRGIDILSTKFTIFAISLIIFGFIIKIIKVRYRRPFNFDRENEITRKMFDKNFNNGSYPQQNNIECPIQCKEEIEDENSIPSSIKLGLSNNIKTDSSLNTWLYGDQPDTLYYNPRIYKGRYKDQMINYRTEDENGYLDKPKPWFQQITENNDSNELINGITYYNCDHKIRPSQEELTTEDADYILINKENTSGKNMPLKFKSSIPCNFYPGYIEKSKCIYDKENNNCKPIQN